MKLLEVEGGTCVPPCPIAGDATDYVDEMLPNFDYLHVERKVFDVDFARRLEYCRRNPENLAVVWYDSHRFSMFLQSRVGTSKPPHTLHSLHFRFVLFIFVLFICQFSFWDLAEDYLCFYSIDQSIIYLWNINSQNSDTSQYTSSTGLQGRKACTDRSPLNRVGQKQLLFFYNCVGLIFICLFNPAVKLQYSQ